VIFVTLTVFTYICIRKRTREKMAWVLLIQGLLALGCAFYIG